MLEELMVLRMVNFRISKNAVCDSWSRPGAPPPAPPHTHIHVDAGCITGRLS